MHNSMNFHLDDDLRTRLDAAIAEWGSSGKIGRIWQKDATVWRGEDEAKWLGWLDIAERELADVQKYLDLQADMANSPFTNVLLMGMGGSSLCPEVLAMTVCKANFHILDSTVPDRKSTRLNS